MFDIGFSELIVVFVVGLLILGPDRLPHAAKTAGLWIRKIRRSINSIQREINMQLDQEELQRKLIENNQRIIKETASIQNTITPLPEKTMPEVLADTPVMKGDAELNNPHTDGKPADEQETLLETKPVSDSNVTKH